MIEGKAERKEEERGGDESDKAVIREKKRRMRRGEISEMKMTKEKEEVNRGE